MSDTAKAWLAAGFVALMIGGCLSSASSSSKPKKGTPECYRAQNKISDRYGTDYDSDDVVRGIHEMSEACS